ncbi:MAG: MFS transporter [Ktedonobacterales bacterium]
MAQASSSRSGAQLTNVTTRLDRLPWGRFHLTVTMALGIVWLLDAFEVNIIGSVIPTIDKVFHASQFQGSLVISVWLIGIMFGALFFGYLADRFGRRKLFMLTLALYASCTLIAALSVSFGMFITFRFLTAIGVGAEYAAVNTAISEFIPAKWRGRTNAGVMSFWNIGAIFSAVISLVFINILPDNVGWRLAFAFGAIAAVLIVWLRRAVPESPRWLVMRGRMTEAERVVGEIEEWVACEKHIAVADLPPAAPAPLAHYAPRSFFSQVGELVRNYPGRLALGCLLDLSEAFGYYGIFAFLPLVVLPAVNISNKQIPLFFIAGDIGALFGGILVVVLLDRVGRKVSVPAFYTMAAITAVLMGPAAATKSGLVVLIAFIVANFFATSAWISAYPTFTEIFPTHLRATGVGMSVAVGRVGAAASAPLLVYVATQTPLGIIGGFVLLALLWLVGAIAMVPWYFTGVEGAARPLEQMVRVPSGVDARAVAEG